MSSFTTVSNTAASYGQAAFSTAGQLQRAFEGDRKRVSFVQGKQTIVQFDAVLQETHTLETSPTVFPVEDGSTVGDHIIVAPVELNLTGIITDTPLNNRNQLFKESITSVANAVIGPLGVLGATAAFAGFGAQQGASSPSFTAYNQLVKLAVGDASGTTTIPPMPFDVVTRLRRYPNMVIKNMSVPRDATTGNALVFTIQLAQMTIVSPQTLTLSLSKLPSVASVKERLENGGDDTDLAEKYRQGVNRADVATGVAERFPGTA